MFFSEKSSISYRHLQLPKKHNCDLSAFEIEGENNTFYTTWSGDSLQSSENVIGINGLFANKLGLVHSQEVTIKKVENVISCNQAFVEPVSVDDWEILELHAEEVESSLLNQVRVVSPGLVFPIWINKSICIFVKIGSLEPSGNCCMLEERTEVHITPKDRKPNMAVPSSSAGVVSAASADQLKTKSKPRKSVSFIDEVQEVKDGTDSQTESSHRDQGLMSSLFNSVKTWWNGEDIEEINNDGKNSKVEKNEFMDSDWCSSLRVQPRGNFKQPTETSDRIPLCISDQPCNVYISRKTFLKHCKVGAGDIMKNCENRTFLAEISRLPSPVEREVLMKKKMERMGSRLAGENADNLLEMAASNDDTDGILRAKSVIRVIVFDENNRHILVNTQQNEISTIHLEDECGVLDNHIMMSDELRRQLGADRTGRVLIKSIRRQAGSQVKTGALNVYPLFPMPEGFTPELLSLALKCWVRLHCDPHMPLIATTAALLNVTLTPDMKKDMLVSFNTEPSQTNASSSDEQQKFITLDPASMEEVVIHVENQLTSENKPGFLTHVPTHTLEGIDTHAIAVELENLGGLGELPSQLTSHICQCLCVSPLTEATYSSTPGLHSGGVMVTGQRGVGKTSLVRGVCKQLVDIPSYVHVAMLDCKQLRGKRVDNIKKTLQRCFTEAAWRQPSIVVLDDLDLICGAPAGPEQEMSGDAMYFAKVAQLICELLKTEMVEKSHICLVVTCKSRAAVHKSLSTSRGLHYFQADIEIQTPDKEQRLQMLTSIVKNNTSISADTVDNLDFTKVVTKTEGYVARDLKTVVQRALHAHTMMNKDNTGDISLTTEDFDVGLHGFTPSCLKNVSLHKPGDLGWEDVGGLHNVRNTLVETLQWPSKYPELFANCPLRLRSGILLYGAPGTGKTLLAGVVAKECGLNFISIKGPELLSKYIGASEQAVRNTFIRAQSARPCILFFDEFDSLAPRRGHDSTGVTDRVVNQLLTQLDGVEGLQGVYVLGATSRPDLIDPALLRPGRLDKALHCDLPSQEERLDILQSLTRNMQLSKDVQLEHLAEICEYFTGADFKALLYNAQLEAIHQVHGHEMQGSIANSGAGKKASENSVLSNGSWETLNLPSKENDVEVVAATGEVLKVRDKTLCQLAYIPTLEKGIKEMTCEEDLQIREKILPLLDDNIKDDDKNEKESTSIVIQAGHFWNAFKTMGPSVTEMERRKYQRIYENFVHSRGGNFNDGMQTVGKRATLA